MNKIQNPEELTWGSILHLICLKLKLQPKEKPSVKANSVQSPENWDRSHLHDWHENTLDKLEPIPEVERYKAYIKMESASRKQRILEEELKELKEEQRRNRNQKKRHKDKDYYDDCEDRPKNRKKKKTKYQSHKKRGRR